MKLYSTSQVAKMLGKSRSTIQRMVKNGQLKPFSYQQGKGGKNGKSPLFDAASIGVIMAKKSDANKSCIGVIKNLTLASQNDANIKKQNNKDIDKELWLSFNTVLYIYKMVLDKTDNSLNDEKIDSSKKCPLKKEVKLTLQDIFSGIGVTTSQLNQDKLQDNFSEQTTNQSPPNTTSISVIGVKLQDIEKYSSPQKKWFSAEYKKLQRDIKSGKVVSRPDPQDNRKTQILYISLPPEQKITYDALSIRREIHTAIKNPRLYHASSPSSGIFSKEKKQLKQEQKAEVCTILYNTPLRYRKNIVKELSTLLGTHSSTLYRWLQKCTNTDGSLDTGKLWCTTHGNHGREKQFPPEVIRYFRSALAAHATFSVEYARKLTNAKYDCQLSSRQARKIVRDDTFLHAVWQMRSHPDQARWNYRFYAKQTRQGIRPLELVTTDGHPMDVKIKSPQGDFRPTVVEIFDVATGMPLGWSIGRSENRELVNRALISALQKYGHFQKLCVDMGKAFWQSSEIKQQIYQHLHLEIVSKVGYSPHLKAHQERNFGELERCIGQLLQRKGYVGHSVSARQRKTISKDAEAVLTYSEFFNITKNYFEIIAPNRLQSGIGNRSAKELWTWWEEEKNFKVKHYFQDPKLEYQALTIALGTRRQITVRHGWIGITIPRGGEKHYYSAPELIKLENRRVNICVNIDNPSKIFVFYGGKLFCSAKKITLPKVGNHTEEIKLLRAESEVVRKKMIKITKQSLDKLDLVAEQDTYLYKNAVGHSPDAYVGEIASVEMNQMVKQLELINAQEQGSDLGKCEIIPISETKETTVAGIFDSSSASEASYDVFEKLE